uniref:Uncharacterized protein n=1 Tax=Eutreptiella gymnastica TaxID=73025 RepID=A0A7S1IFM6_9EUGL
MEYASYLHPLADALRRFGPYGGPQKVQSMTLEAIREELTETAGRWGGVCVSHLKVLSHKELATQATALLEQQLTALGQLMQDLKDARVTWQPARRLDRRQDQAKPWHGLTVRQLRDKAAYVSRYDVQVAERMTTKELVTLVARWLDLKLHHERQLDTVEELEEGARDHLWDQYWAHRDAVDRMKGVYYPTDDLQPDDLPPPSRWRDPPSRRELLGPNYKGEVLLHPFHLKLKAIEEKYNPPKWYSRPSSALYPQPHEHLHSGINMECGTCTGGPRIGVFCTGGRSGDVHEDDEEKYGWTCP